MTQVPVNKAQQFAKPERSGGFASGDGRRYVSNIGLVQ